MLFAIIEGARFIFFYEMLNNATREGARYAIVHGSASSCPTGPPPPGETNPCPEPDGVGHRVKVAVASAATGLIGGTLAVPNPVWTASGSDIPDPGDPNSGTYERGNYVTVFAEYKYSTLIPILPPITVNAESTLVVNH